MQVLYMDYETFWSTEHSLTNLSAIEYVVHPDTEIISLAYAFDDGPVHVIFGEDKIAAWASSVDWSSALVVAHNNEGFDSLISAWRFGIKPKMWGCTLAMARPIHAKVAGGSLKALAEHYGLSAKGSLEATHTKGKHLKDFTPEELSSMREYNKTDVEICRSLFKVLLPFTSKEEMRLIDMTIRMLVEPKFLVDEELLARTLRKERDTQADLLHDLAVSLGWGVIAVGEAVTPAEYARQQLASAPKFAAFLKSRGVEPPMKKSPTNPDRQTYALAKTDEAFIALQSHEDEVIAAAARARLNVKSTLLQTRIEAFLTAASATGGRLPIPTKYYGADTTGRRSGWLYNPLNLPRVSGRPSDCLRLSMLAPKGHKVVVADLSGIELRMNHFLWKVPSSMSLFNADPEKADLYIEFAASLFGVERGAVTRSQRQIAKIAQLGLQYGAGAATFRRVAKIMGGVDLSLEECQDIVDKWRAAYLPITVGWRASQYAIESIALGQCADIDPWGLMHTSPEGIVTPKGLIRYPKLRKEFNAEGKEEWVYGMNRSKSKIYGSKAVENEVQHLSRFVITDAALEMRKRTEFTSFPALEVYDELVYVVPDSVADDVLAELLDVLRTPPKWFPQLAVWAEGAFADDYGSVK